MPGCFRVRFPPGRCVFFFLGGGQWNDWMKQQSSLPGDLQLPQLIWDETSKIMNNALTKDASSTTFQSSRPYLHPKLVSISVSVFGRQISDLLGSNYRSVEVFKTCSVQEWTTASSNFGGPATVIFFPPSGLQKNTGNSQMWIGIGGDFLGCLDCWRVGIRNVGTSMEATWKIGAVPANEQRIFCTWKSPGDVTKK